MSVFVPEPQHEQIRKRYHEGEGLGKTAGLIWSLLLSLLIGVALARLASGALAFFRSPQHLRALIGVALLIVGAPLLVGWLVRKRSAWLKAALDAVAGGARG